MRDILHYPQTSGGAGHLLAQDSLSVATYGIGVAAAVPPVAPVGTRVRT